MISEDGRGALSCSDEEDLEDENHIPEMKGILSKWTNYIHGWQDRFIVVKHGTISYYKSQQEAMIGCRGTVSLAKAIITAHEFDDCRFDVGINDCLWYLRASSLEDRIKWVNILELHKQVESGYGSETSLRRHGSHLSLTSTASLSTASASSFKRGRGLREKLAEMETFKDILCRQVDSLQNYFDACASAITQYTVHDAAMVDDINEIYDYNNQPTTNQNNHSINHNNDHVCLNNQQLESQNNGKDLVNLLRQHGAHAADFKGESFTFKATTAGILATLAHCIDLMAQREDAWKKRLDKEIEKRKKLQDSYKNLLNEKLKPVILGGPDYEEGPHSMLNDEEFFDAVDATLDKLEKEEGQKLQNLIASSKKVPKTFLDPAHPLFKEINEVVDTHIRMADMTCSDVADSWTLVASEGEMKVYKREVVEQSGNVVYPLKAVHTVKGITGHELCHYFWDPTVRMEWESTLESSQVLQWLSSDTNVTCQVLKRVWPAAQRDSVFWTTIRHCPGGVGDKEDNDETPDYWIVVNHSTDHLPAPTNLPKCIRLQFNVAMICQTVVQPPINSQPITRDSLTCKIQYSANVNPGGWVPASVIQIICKREAPKFLKNFTAYVQEKTKDKEIMF